VKINKVAVIGSGTMGAGIAGQVANAGIEVWLLDLPSEGDDVNAIAKRGLERLKDPDMPGLMSKDAEALIHLGNIRDDLAVVKDCDWVAEAVVERLDIKHQLYANLVMLLPETAILTSNTSTIPISLLTQGMPDSLQQRFAITHFFNPVRFMRLLELVRGEHTRDDVMETLELFCEEQLGKGVVNCADTPGFLGNRVGVYAIQCALHEAFAAGLKPQVADALFGRPMGIPKTGVFGLYDLIGIDLMSDVVASLVSILPETDAFHAVSKPLPLMVEMIQNGQTGNKQGKGFYFQETPESDKQVLDFESKQYQNFDRPVIEIALKAEQDGVKNLLDDDSEYGQYAWRVLSQTLCYAASLLPEVGNDPSAVDDAMKLGYNWIKGPFELIDEIGVDYLINRLQNEGREIPAILQQAAGSHFYQADETALSRRLWSDNGETVWQPIDRAVGVTRFSETRQTLTPVAHNRVASWYVYQNMAVVEFHSKANALDAESMAILNDALDQVKPMGLAGLIVHNDAQHFSCGVNLEAVRGFFNQQDYDGLDKFLADFQTTVHKMAAADFPVVAAPSGLSIGGGFEVVLHAQHVICHANSVLGLVESLVGVIPGGGGCKETLYRWVENLNISADSNVDEAAWKAFMNLGYGKTATSPQLALQQAMLRADDSYLMNRDRLLAAAVNYIKQNPTAQHANRPPLRMPGREVNQAMGDWLDKHHAKGVFTPHDTVVGKAIAAIVTGGDIDAGTVWSEQDLYDAERRAFLHLVKTDGTQARINSMLDLGRTLRN
jgi:3-hydroxyacyl-CoA dehydrogenase